MRRISRTTRRSSSWRCRNRPTKSRAGVCISLVLFRPHRPRETYSKRYLHPDENPFFVGGSGAPGLIGEAPKVALAICYELSVPEHAEGAHRLGADVYVASVAKFVGGVEKAASRLSEIARHYSMPVLMANCVGRCDGCDCAGQTSAWDSRGALAARLDDRREGIVVLDTDGGRAGEATVSTHYT